MTDAIKQPEAIVIGVSAGGVEVLTDLFTSLPEKRRVPIFTVLHIHPDSRSMLTLFQRCCDQKIVEPMAGEAIEPGSIYLAPPDYHMIIENKREISLGTFARVNYCRPAIDPMFFSAAMVYGKSLMGIVLTGANDDGAKGLDIIQRQGGTTIVQNPETASVKTMPRSAAPFASHIMEQSEIKQLLQRVC